MDHPQTRTPSSAFGCPADEKAHAAQSSGTPFNALGPDKKAKEQPHVKEERIAEDASLDVPRGGGEEERPQQAVVT